MITTNRQKRIDELTKSIRLIQYHLAKVNSITKKIGWLRLTLFLGGLILFFLLYFLSFKIFAVILTSVLFILFLLVSNIQSKFIYRALYIKRWLEIKESFLARATLDWKKLYTFTEFHQFSDRELESDLDLTGDRSIHQLIDLCKSTEGKYLLRRMLVEPPKDINEVWQRQKLVKELTSISHFRNKFLLINHLSSKNEFKTTALLEWLKSKSKRSLVQSKYFILALLALLNLAFIGYCFLINYSQLWLISTSIYLMAYFFNQRIIKSSAADAEFLNEEFKKIVGPIELVERYNFRKGSELERLTIPLKAKGKNPGTELKRISLVLELLSLRANPYLWFLVVMIWPIDYLLALMVEKSKERISEHLPEWLDILHQLEAYISIATFGYLNPDYKFPQIVESTDNKIEITADELGHPLIEHAHRVRNNFSLSGSGSIQIITGSNMSGKSTFLRTLGVNLCLAYAGAPVDAQLFKISFCELFTCIKVSDSVIDGISYFYAEVKRLRKLLDLLEEEINLPVLFLIDEIFKGTNNLERHTGSAALINFLLKKNGSGLVSTHDLELIKLADDSTKIQNFHFREEISDGKMIFDYKLRPGPCPTTNALKIMEINGLPIS